MSLKCTRKGCGKDYEESSNDTDSCQYHPGGPVFHEGLKSWSCCADVNKPVLDFESFLAVPGCATGRHSSEKPKVEPARSTGISNYKDAAPAAPNVSEPTTTHAPVPGPPKLASIVTETRPRTPVVEEEVDDLAVPVAVGTKCLRNGCGQAFVSDAASRQAGGTDALCVYHPAPPLFREGSKGYLCCKRRVLEFEEFLKIDGCKQGSHLFVRKRAANAGPTQEELVTCRIDHYQTPARVHASVFAKQANKAESSIRFEETKIDLDIALSGSRRFVRTLQLYGPIDPTASTSTFYGTKVELVLVKRDTRSWNSLERTAQDIGHVTFGVGGRTGTVGSRTLVLDEGNKLRTAA